MKVRHYFEFALVQLLRLIFRILPRRGALWLGRRIGGLAYRLDPRHRKGVLANLDLAYRDEISTEEKERIARGAYHHFGSMLVDIVRTQKWRPEQIETIAEFEGWENLEEAYGRGKGVLILTAHFGNWELMGVAQGFRGRNIHVVARVLDNPLLEKLLHRFRTCSGNTVVYKLNAVKAVMDILKERQGTAVLIDQNVNPNRGIFVDFFGVPACTTTVVSALAVRTGAPIVPAFSLPLPGGRWRFIYEKPIEVADEGNRQETIAELTQRCTAIIERYVRQRPDVWLWMHRRWKTQPTACETEPGA